MGYIACKIHGENVARFISEYHAEKIFKMEESVNSEIIFIEVLDKNELFNGSYIVDPSLVRKIGIQESKIDLESEFYKYEIMFNKLSPVCSKCLNRYLKRE